MTQNSLNFQNQIKHTEYKIMFHIHQSNSNMTGNQCNEIDQGLNEGKMRSNCYKSSSQQAQDIQTEADNHIKQCLSNTENTIKHKIVIINNNSQFRQLVSFTSPTIIISGNLYGGIIVKYEIIVGNYRLKVDLLNMEKKAPNTLIKIGYGGHRSIYKIKYTKTKSIVAKRIPFKSKKTIKFEEKQIIPNRLQIHESLYQYSIYKICSFYKIGPQIANELGFDVVCFANCLQFYMEECLRVKTNSNRIENDLKLQQYFRKFIEQKLSLSFSEITNFQSAGNKFLSKSHLIS